MLRVLLAFTIVALGVAACRAQTAPPNLAPTTPDATKIEQVVQAFQLFQSQRFNESLKLLEAARKEHPYLPPAQLMQARLHFAFNQAPQGKGLLERTAREAPKDPDVYLAFAQVALAEGRLTDALVHFEKARSLPAPAAWTGKQKEMLALEVLGGEVLVAENRQDWAIARTKLKEWLTKKPDDPGLLARLARAEFYSGNEAEAFKQLKRSTQENPTLPPAEISLAALHASKGQRDKAVKILEDAAKASPKEFRFFRELAALYMMAGKNVEASAMIDKAETLGDLSREVRLTKGMLKRRLKKYDEAIAAFESIRKQAPEDFEATNQIALCLAESMEAAKKQASIRIAETNARRTPNSGQALSTLGWVYFRNGRTAQGEQLLRAAAGKPDMRTETAYFLARVFTELGRQPEAAAAKKLLRDMMKGPGVFVLRDEAEKWLEANASPAGPPAR